MGSDDEVEERTPQHAPLYTAAQEGQAAEVGRLIAAGADVNWTGAAGETALIVAVRRGHVAVVGRLIDAGADPRKADKAGWPPLSIARRHGHKALVGLLNVAGAFENQGQGKLSMGEVWVSRPANSANEPARATRQAEVKSAQEAQVRERENAETETEKARKREREITRKRAKKRRRERKRVVRQAEAKEWVKVRSLLGSGRGMRAATPPKISLKRKAEAAEDLFAQPKKRASVSSYLASVCLRLPACCPCKYRQTEVLCARSW
jgi:hypothetical protein